MRIQYLARKRIEELFELVFEEMEVYYGPALEECGRASHDTNRKIYDLTLFLDERMSEVRNKLFEHEGRIRGIYIEYLDALKHIKEELSKFDLPDLRETTLSGILKYAEIYLECGKDASPKYLVPRTIHYSYELKRMPIKKFRNSKAWRELRYKILKKYDGKCNACGQSEKDGVILHVDHIKPVSKFWELRFDENNLQILCEDCNLGKGAWDESDWRGSSPLHDGVDNART